MARAGRSARRQLTRMEEIAEARERLGDLLRQLRREGGSSVAELALALEWAPSRVRELESGRQTPTVSEINDWLQVLGYTHLFSTVTAELEAIEAFYLDTTRDVASAGVLGIQARFAKLEANATFIRCFEPHFIPGLMQTPEYAAGRISAGISMHLSEEVLAAALDIRLQRQATLRDPERSFNFLISEASVSSGSYFESAEIRRRQASRLIQDSHRPNVTVSVVPSAAYWTMNIDHGFWVFDESACYVETIFAELLLTQTSEIRTGMRQFQSLMDLAVHDDDARTLLQEYA